MESWRVGFSAGVESEFFIQRTPDIVTVCALTDTGEVLLLKEYLIGPEQVTYKLIGGTTEENETPEELARQELREEAGAVAREFVSLGWSFQDKYNTGKCFYFLALGAECVTAQSLSPNEAIDAVLPTPLASFRVLVESGVIHPAVDLVCAMRAMAYLDKRVEAGK